MVGSECSHQRRCSRRGGARGAGDQPAAAGHADRVADLRPAPAHHRHLRGDLRRRVLGDVLFDLRAPQVKGPPGRAVPREHDWSKSIWTVIPFLILLAHGLPGDQDHSGDEGHVRSGHDRQGHRLPVEMAVRLSRPRLLVRQQPGDAADADPQPGPQGRALPARRRRADGRADGQEGARADHRRRCDPRVVGARVRREAGRDSRVRARQLVQGRKARASTAANAPSCAARSMASCRSSSR